MTKTTQLKRLQEILITRFRLFSKGEERGLLFLTIILGVIFVCLLPLRHAGWPQDHEGLAFMARTAIYADHFRHGDFLPIWSSSDAFGMGTPLPLFYHKTFYVISAMSYLLVGSIKLAIALSVALFMLVGAYGMRACVQILVKPSSGGSSPKMESKLRMNSRKRLILSIAAPIAFLLANYTFTDWLIRGAMAEFSAMMIIPWLIWWCLKLVRQRVFSLSIAPILFLLFDAHNVSALYGGFILLIAGTIFLADQRWGAVRLVWKRALIAGTIFGLLVLPQLILQHAFLRDYNPGKITQAGFKASENFHPAGDYFINSNYTWLTDWRTYNVQIDYPIWIVLSVAIVILLFKLLRQPQNISRLRDKTISYPWLLLSLSFLIMLLLQFKLSRSFYTTVPLTEYLQFPWRLLAYLTPLGILLVIFAANSIKNYTWLKIFAVSWLGVFFVLSPLTHHFKYDFIAPSYSQAATTARPGGLGGLITGIGEYLPRTTQHNQELSSLQTLAVYQSLYEQNRQTEVLDGDCQVSRQSSSTFDPTELKFVANCTTDSKIALPISYNGFSEIQTSHGTVNYQHNPNDPRIIVELPAGQNNQLDIKLPTAFRVVTKLL